MIGDSLEADVFGAVNFGLKAIHLNLHNNEKKKEREFITINSLIELKQYL